MAAVPQARAILYERRVLKDLRPPFVLRLLTTYQSKNVCYFLVELVQGGELFSRITSFDMDDFPPDEAKSFRGVFLGGASRDTLSRIVREAPPLVSLAWFLGGCSYALRMTVDLVSLSVGGPDFRDGPFVAKARRRLSRHRYLPCSCQDARHSHHHRRRRGRGPGRARGRGRARRTCTT